MCKWIKNLLCKKQKKRVHWGKDTKKSFVSNDYPTITVIIPYHVIDQFQFDSVYESLLSLADQTSPCPVYLSISFENEEVRTAFYIYWSHNGLLEGYRGATIDPFDSVHHVWNNFSIFFHDEPKQPFQHIKFLSEQIHTTYVIMGDIDNLSMLDRIATIRRHIQETKEVIFTEKYCDEDKATYKKHTHIVLMHNILQEFLEMNGKFLHEPYCGQYFVEYMHLKHPCMGSIYKMKQTRNAYLAYEVAIYKLYMQYKKLHKREQDFWEKRTNELTHLLFLGVVLYPKRQFVETMSNIFMGPTTLRRLLSVELYTELYIRHSYIYREVNEAYDNIKKYGSNPHFYKKSASQRSTV